MTAVHRELTPRQLLERYLGGPEPQEKSLPWCVLWDKWDAAQRADLLRTAVPPRVAVGTSGTTGSSATWWRTRGQLIAEAEMLAGLLRGRGVDQILAFAPPAHLYGLLTTLLVPAVLGVPVWYQPGFDTPLPRCDGRMLGVAAIPWTFRILDHQYDAIAGVAGLAVLHSTAALPPGVAEFTGRCDAGRVTITEIFGSTETGGIAHRLHGQETWTLFDDVTPTRDGAGGDVPLVVSSPRLAEHLGQWATGDVVAIVDERHLILRGRRNRLRKINGVRVDLDKVERHLAETVVCQDIACVPVSDVVRGESFSVLVVASAASAPDLPSTVRVAAKAWGLAPHDVRVVTPTVAITGVSLSTGFAGGTEETWQRILAGEIAVRAAPRFDGAYVSEAADADQLLTALAEDAEATGLPPDTGVVFGTNGAPESAWQQSKPYGELDVMADALGAQGPRVVFGTGCIAGTNALCYAVDVLRAGRARAMVVVGVERLSVTTIATFSSWRALDSAPSRPYERSAGVNLGEGAAMLVLEADPPADKPVIAYVNGYGLSSDAFHATSPPPDGDGLARALRLALDDANVRPEDVHYINGHGTGTRANDTAELAAMQTVFGTNAPPISSTKPQLGHTLGASGVAETVIIALALRDQRMPPTANVDPAIAAAMDWDIVPEARSATIDVAVNNSLAFGGANAVVVLGRRPRAARDVPTRRLVEQTAEAFVTGVDAARELVPRVYLARLDELGLLTMAAGHAVWAKAGYGNGSCPEPERIGLIFATATGPVRTIEELHHASRRGELGLISPVTAPNIVASVTAGYLCQSLSIKGPLSAVTSGVESASIALSYATELLEQGRADVMLVVSANENGEGSHARILVARPSCTS
jgi:3-oxoacyl-[acyl-carrier-protein] synthase II